MADMAVKEESLHHATEDLVLPKPRKYYRARIDTEHWQLRSLISSPEQNILYYPSGSNIYALNTKSRERVVVATIPFSLRCLVAAKSWLCCGGEKGNYTFISLSDRISGIDSMQSADADARLPLDLEPSRRSISWEEGLAVRIPRGLNRAVVINSTKVGSEIVNCITLWSPRKDSSERAYRLPVAVLSSNDCTVSILNVKTSEILDKLTFPDLVNRSVISPSGELLATIGDDPFLYIHERKEKWDSPRTRADSKPGSNYEWVQTGRIQLEGQRQTDKTTMRGSFAVCFSTSGKYLAVATQYGVISVFDAQSLPDPESLMVVFTSSRPGGASGAVRAMEFSPGPFDLLAWTETSGRVGVADVRTLFLSRQRITIDSHAENVERVPVLERPSERPVTLDDYIDPRLHYLRTGESPPSRSTPDYLGLSLDSERRQLRQLTNEMLDRHQAPLTIEELEVLQAHRLARRQRDAANTSHEAETSVSSRLGTLGDTQRSSSRVSGAANGTTGEGTGALDRRISTIGLPAALREFVNPDRTAASFRSFINERNRENERRSQLQQGPRRRNSMSIAAVENAIERETLGPEVDRGNDTSSGLERLTLTASLQASDSDSSNNPWAEINSLYRSRFPADPPLDRSTRLRIEVEDDDRNDFAHRLRQPWRPLDELSLGIREEALLRDVLHADDTMGCCWSEDGRILYAGAKDGIYEFHVNLTGRKLFPSLVLQ